MIVLSVPPAPVVHFFSVVGVNSGGTGLCTPGGGGGASEGNGILGGVKYVFLEQRAPVVQYQCKQ